MKTAKLMIALLFFAGLLMPSASFAQDTDEIMSQFVRPRLLMRYRKELGLTKEQRTKIKQHVKDAQSKSIDVQFELDQEMQKLKDLVSNDKVDKKAAIAQANKVMGLESQMKSLQLGLMIDIKNELTPEQIEKIKDYRQKQRKRRRDRKR